VRPISFREIECFLLLGFCPTDVELKRHRLVQFAALQAAGTVHVRIVGIDEAAFRAAEHAVFRVRRAKPATAHFGINPQATKRNQQARHINHDKPGGGHIFNHEWTPRDTNPLGVSSLNNQA
jgi:hypothetical protein